MTFEITEVGRKRLHDLLNETLDAMVEHAQLAGDGHDLIIPTETSIRGVKVHVDLRVMLTPKVGGQTLTLEDFARGDRL